MSTSPIKVAVTGAAGQIGYSLLFHIASGALFGPDAPVELRLLEITPALKSLEGVVMELNDCAFPTLAAVEIGDDPNTMFEGVNLALLVGARPRGPGMERSDLLEANGAIFTGQGKALNDHAADDVRITVTGNPANTNALIASAAAPDVPAERFTAMTRLDQNRAYTQIAKKAGVAVTAIHDLVIYGNHSPSMFSDFLNGRINGKAITDVISDHAWLKETLLPTVGKRGAAIIEARGASSAASAANALIDHVKALCTISTDLHSLAVYQDGQTYGFPEGIWASVPVRTTAYGTYTIDRSFSHDEFAKAKIKASSDELAGERDLIKDML